MNTDTQTVVEPAAQTVVATPEELLQKALAATRPDPAKKGARGKFRQNIETIRALRRRQFSYTQIHKFLNENGLKCSYIGLVLFCKGAFNKKG